jgi:tetratricopeptide (TPR) repeat protein
LADFGYSVIVLTDTLYRRGDEMEAQEWFELACRQYASNDLPKALESLTKGLDGDVPSLLRQRMMHAIATVNGQLRNHEEAVSWWEEFFHPRNYTPDMSEMKIAVGHYNFGYQLRKLGRYEEAIAQYYKALPFFVKHGEYVARCWQNLAWAQCLAGHLHDAKLSLNYAEGYVNDTVLQEHQRVGYAFLYSLTGQHMLASDLCDELSKSSDMFIIDGVSTVRANLAKAS